MKQKVIHFLEIHFCKSSILGYSFAALLQYIFHFDKPKWYIGERKEIPPYHCKRLTLMLLQIPFDYQKFATFLDKANILHLFAFVNELALGDNANCKNV